MTSPNEIDLTVVVNGQPLQVSENIQAPLRTLIEHALHQSGNSGQPIDNWELRDGSGQILDPTRKIGEFNFTAGTRLFLSLKAGVGGQTVSLQHVDPTVSRKKFDREIAEYQALSNQYRERGWLLVHAEFPKVLVVLAAPKLKPAAIVMGVAFDYTNYDAVPPSVRIVNPFTGEPYKARDLPTQLNRSLPQQEIAVPGMPSEAKMVLANVQSLMQAYGPDEIPFLCLAGVREYHDHPAHSGDVWELHRASGAGRLVRLLEIIHRFGTEPINGYNVKLVPQVSFNYGQPPL